jgi:Fructose-bisphosphate aldolase class-II
MPRESVEAELGQIGGKKGAHSAGARTDPHDAMRFVEETGVDAVAVAVGSSHAMTDRTAELALDLITKIKKNGASPSCSARLLRSPRRNRSGTGWNGQDQHRDRLESSPRGILVWMLRKAVPLSEKSQTPDECQRNRPYSRAAIAGASLPAAPSARGRY